VPTDGAHPWNQNTFTAPHDGKPDQQGNAAIDAPAVVTTPKQLELLPDQATPTYPPQKDLLETPKRRFAQTLPRQKATHPLLSFAIQPTIE
jgi:hypothetical protein